MKLITSIFWYSRDCLVIVQSVNICLVQGLPSLNPACSSHNLLSILSCIHLRLFWQNTLPAAESKIVPHQLLHSRRLPFLRTLMMTPLVQSAGTWLPFHVLLKICTNWYTIAFCLYFKSLKGIAPIPTASLFFRDRIAAILSLMKILLINITCEFKVYDWEAWAIKTKPAHPPLIKYSRCKDLQLVDRGN